MHNDFASSPFWKEYEKAIMDNITGKGLSVDAIRSMSLDEYAKVRDQLLTHALPPRPTEQQVSCMWCGKPFGVSKVDEHELECGA